MKLKTAIPIAVFSLFVTVAHGSLSTNNVRLNLDVTSQVRGTDYTDESVVSIGPSAAGVLSVELTSDVPARAQIDALAVYSNQIVFSLDVDCVIDGIAYADEDLVAYNVNSSAFTNYLTGTNAGISAKADIDAACFAGTNLLLSFDTATVLPGSLSVDDDDVVRYAGETFMKVYDGLTDIGIPVSADVDALYHDGTNLYFSLDKTATINGSTGTDEDVWVFDTLSSNVTLISGIGLEARADLASLDYPLDSDGDWLTDLEEYSGEDEAASTYPGTSTALSPGGNTSDPFVTDSDGDGLGDGAEAACGTDPGDQNDVLKLVDISVASTNVIVTWRSVSGKSYDLKNTASVVEGFTNQVESSYSAASGTNITVYTNYNASANTGLFYRVKLAL